MLPGGVRTQVGTHGLHLLFKGRLWVLLGPLVLRDNVEKRRNEGDLKFQNIYFSFVLYYEQLFL